MSESQKPLTDAGRDAWEKALGPPGGKVDRPPCYCCAVGKMGDLADCIFCSAPDWVEHKLDAM